MLKKLHLKKKVANDMSVWVCDKAIQLHGVYGYSAEYEVERFYSDAEAGLGGVAPHRSV